MQSRSPHPPKTTRTAEIRKQTATVQRQIQRDQEKAKVEDQDDGVVYTATGTTISSSQQTFTAAAFASAHKKKLQQQQTANTANGTINNSSNKNGSSARSIGHSGTSQSASALAAETSQQLASFEAVFALMSNPSTAEQFDRHASQLSALLPQLLPRSSIPAKLADPSSSHGGLPAIIKQVAHAVATNEAAAGLGGSLAQLLELASFPIQCSTLHDQRALPVCVVALLEAVSTSLFEPHTLSIRTQAATVMRDIIRRVNERCGVDIRSSTNLSTIGKAGSTIKSKNAAEIASNAAVTTTSSTGSTVQELRGAVTKQSVLALAEAWSSAIDREYNAAIDFAKSSAAQNSNNTLLSNTAISGDDSEVSILNSNNKRDTTAASTNVNKPTATVDGISRQIQQRDSALEVVAILQALAAVSCNRTRALWLIEDAKADQLIFRTLLLANGDARTPLCIEMIWNLLQLCPEDTGYFATRDNFEILQNTLRVTVSEGHIAARRELRNDILVVFGLLAEVAPDSQCASGNLVDLVLELACGAELGLTVSSASTVGNNNNNNNVAGTVVPLNYKQHHTTRAEDMQLKLLGWDLLRRWCVADEDLAELAFSSRFFEALLCYIDVTCENKAVVAWSTSQLLELQEHSLRNLEELVRVGCDFFCTSNGPAICVSYLLECPARPPTLLQCAISLLAEAASSNARKLVAETGAIPLALRLLSSVPLSRETISRHVDCLTLIADLVDRTEVYQNEFYNNRGVEILMPLLLGAVEFADLGDELMLAATDCVWGCILGSNRNEQRFMEVGGVGALLAVLDMRKILGEAHDAKQKTLASSMQKSTRFASQTASTLQNEEDSAIAKQFSQDAANFPLACLADLLMYPGAPESAKKWRSTKTNRSGVQILLSLWKMEQVPTEIIKEGTITAHTASKFDVGCAVLGTASRDPLAVGKGIFENAGEKDRSELSRIIPVSSRDPTFVSRNGIVVPPQDIRNLAFAFRKNLKVFSAISSIGYHGHHELELEERATLTTIQQFVALCKDEVWETVSNSLAEAGVDPTDADWETLRQLREAAEQRACGLQATRAAFSEMHRRQREIAEKTFYEALIKRNEERGLSGTAKGQHQLQQKQQQDKNNTTNTVKQSSAANNFIPGLGGANQLSSSTEIPGGGVSGECSIDGADSPPNLSMPHGGAGSVRFAPNMSITEAKMRNKQMLKSSFKHPVRNAAGSQQQSQQQTGFLQLEDVSVDHSHGQFGESKSEYPVDENNNNNNEIMFSSGHLAAGIEKFAGSVMTKWGVGQRSMNEDEFILFEVINTLRTHPRSLVPIFEAALKRYDADSGSIAPIPDTSDDPIICEEGPKCIREAIDFLKKVRPLSVLLDVPAGLLFAARDFVKTAQDRLDNIAEEESPAASEQRLARYGKVEGKKMQLVALGSNSAESIIVQLVLGDGNPERPERAALFDADFRCCGCTIAEHPVYRHVAYISMTAAYLDKPHHEQKSAHEALWSDI